MTRYLFIIVFTFLFGDMFSSVSATKEIKKSTKVDDCRDLITKLEKEYDIPRNLLHAIAQVESKIHPWAVNANGKSRFFKTKEQAVSHAQMLRNKRVKNIGVGCMQINLSAHGKKFTSIAHAFDPSTNIKYSAKLLRSHYDRFGDWKKAVQFYHTATPKFHKPYGNRVYRVWNRIQGEPDVVAPKGGRMKIGYGPGMGMGNRLD